MAKFANMYNGYLGNLLGDVEIAMYKEMRSRNINSINLDWHGITYEIKIAPSPDTNQIKAVFVDGIPVLRSNIHHVLGALEALEDTEK